MIDRRQCKTKEKGKLNLDKKGSGWRWGRGRDNHGTSTVIELLLLQEIINFLFINNLEYFLPI